MTTAARIPSESKNFSKMIEKKGKVDAYFTGASSPSTSVPIPFFPHGSSLGGALLRRFAHQMRILSTMEKMTQAMKIQNELV
nr:hypothetical protein [Candidatus Sigynarchaeum springense]